MSDEYPLMAFIANEGVAPKGERYDRSALVTDTVNKLYKKTEKGDFIYSSNNLETGSIGLNKYGKACISPVYSIFEPTGIADSDFLGRRLVRKDFINAMVKWRQGVIYGQWRIHESDFLKIKITVPSVEEQRKIGTYLDQLDHLITLHQRQHFLHSTPDISLSVRLIHPFYTSSWEQRKLGELVDRVVRKNTNNESTLPLTISAQYGLVDQITYFNNRVASRDVSNYYLVLNGEFAYNKSTSDGYPFGAVKRLDLYEKGVLSTLYIVFAPKKEQQIDSDYLTVFFDTDRWHKGVAERAAEGARNHGLLNISAEDFFDIDLSVPKDIVEQKQIGAFIRQLDNLITLHQRKFEKLTNVKKSMLEKMFPQNGSSYPEIRFKGFTDPWEQRKLGDIGKARSGVGFPDADQGGVTGVPFFKVSDMNLDGNENEMIVANNYVTAEQIADHRWSPITELPAIFFAKVGAAVMLNRKRLCRFPFLLDNNTMAYSLSPTKWDADFAKALFGTVDLTSLVQVGALPSYNAGDVESMGIYLPSLFEQEQIGAFFKLLDNLITLHQRECISFTGRADRLILTANKKRTTSSWEQRKVSDLAEKTYGGGTPTTSNEAYWNGDIPWIQSSDVVDGKLLGVEPRKWITQDGLNNSAAQLIPGNSIAIITRVGVGKLAFMPYSYATSQDFLSLSKLNAEPLFTVYACYKKLQSELNAVQGTSIKGITKDELLAKNIMVPRYAEQQQIGAFFKQLDNLITLHQRKPFLMKWRTSDANRNQTNRLVL